MTKVGTGVIPFGDPDSFLRDVLESSTEYSIIAADPGMRVLLWNEGARRIYGYTPDQIVGADLRILNAPEERAPGKVEHVLQLALLHGKWEGVLRSRRKS